MLHFILYKVTIEKYSCRQFGRGRKYAPIYLPTNR
jgi:hypothetical protein